MRPTGVTEPLTAVLDDLARVTDGLGLAGSATWGHPPAPLASSVPDDPFAAPDPAGGAAAAAPPASAPPPDPSRRSPPARSTSSWPSSTS